MQLRAKLRKTFSYKKNGSGESTPSTESYTGRTDIEYYKPNEIPKSKYRGRVDKAHQEKLAAFSLADAFATVRRKSSQAWSGSFSPGGTKSQSRRTSWMSSTSMRTPSATGSERDSASIQRKSATAGDVPEEVSRNENEVHETDGAIPVISRTATASDRPPQLTGIDIPTVRLERTATVSPGHETPFTTEELEQAMTRATLRPREFGEEKADDVSMAA